MPSASPRNTASVSPVAGRGDDAYETSRTFLRRNFSQLPNQPRVVGLIVGIVSHQVRLVRGVTRRIDSRSPAQRIYFQTGIVRQNNFARNVKTVAFRLLARIGLEGQTIFDHRGMDEKSGTDAISIS